MQLNPEVKLLRVLLRTDCDGVRKSMLQERLQLANHDIFLVSAEFVRETNCSWKIVDCPEIPQAINHEEGRDRIFTLCG